MKYSTIGLCIIIFVFASFAGMCRAANPQVTLHVTGGVTGDIVLVLYSGDAPVTVENFITYVQSGHFDGLIFHRVIENFMIQTGGFDTELVQKPTEDPIINESSNGLTNLRGTIAMARTSNPDSATSQFFVNLVDNTNLDRTLLYDENGTAYYRVGYCVFGQVVAGMNIVDLIAAVETEDGIVAGGITFNDVPVTDIIIQTAEITLNGPVCSEKLSGDIDSDCDVDIADFAILAQNWLACNSITGCN